MKIQRALAEIANYQVVTTSELANVPGILKEKEDVARIFATNIWWFGEKKQIIQTMTLGNTDWWNIKRVKAAKENTTKQGVSQEF